jgi:DNA (cytosine-5)-methyltransferase 1
MLTSPSVGSLFTGIGGIDLGLERAGFRVAWMCERDEYCQRVLAKHWPDVPIYDDATNLPDDVERVDVLTAGFPCQPVSYAGRRNAQDDERWLWPHVENIIRALRPRGVLLENVPGLFTAGFDDVIGGLAACGYDAEWDCIPAAAVGAPHRRDRVFVIAAPYEVATGGDINGWPNPMEDTSGPRSHRTVGGELAQPAGLKGHADAAGPCGSRDSEAMAYAASERRSGSRQLVQRGNATQDATRETGLSLASRERRQWPPEPDVGRVADGVPNRVDRLRALGNAVVPQVAEYVGHQLARMMGVRDA